MKDEFKIEIGKVGEKAKVLPPTKRRLLSVLASLFDLLGLISPVIVFAIILFQLRSVQTKNRLGCQFH